MFMRSAINFLISLLLLSSCAGYKLRHNKNPFLEQGIKSITVPTFVNRTTYNSLTPLVTRETIEILSSFHGLKVNTGKLTYEDAVVVGVITENESKKYTNSVLMNDEQRLSIGQRNAFYVPTIGSFSTNIKLVILKRPSKEEIEFFTSYFKLSKNAFPRTVLYKSFTLSGSYSVENDVGDIDSAAPVRGVKNLGNLRKSIESSTEQYGKNLKEVIINAF
jgi:hypothetical protein